MRVEGQSGKSRLRMGGKELEPALNLEPLIVKHKTYPDPVTGDTFILHYHLQAPVGQVAVQIFNNAKQKIADLTGPIREGENNLLLDSSGLNDGLYSYSLEVQTNDLKHVKSGFFTVHKAKEG